MAASKRNTRSAKTNYKAQPARKKKTPASEITGLLLLVLGIYLFICVIMESAGIVGDAVKGVMRGLFGLTAYVAPLGLVALGGALIMRSSAHRKKAGLLAYILVVWSLFCLFGLFFTSQLDRSSYVNFLVDAYTLGQNAMLGAGAFAAVLLFPAITYLGTIGSFLLFATIILVVCIVKFRLSLRKTGEGIKEAGERIVQSTGRVVEEHRQTRAAQRTARTHQPLFVGDVTTSPSGAAPDVELITPTVFDSAAQPKENAGGGPDLFYESRQERGSAAQLALFGQDGALQQFEPAPAAEAVPVPAEKPVQEKNTAAAPQEAKAKTETIRIPPLESAEEKPAQYQLPPITLLDENPDKQRRMTTDEYMDGARRLEETLMSFGVKCKVVNVSAGPAITRYEMQPAPGVKISRIVNLSNDIALSMAASGVRIEAPIPGKAAIGVEVPNASVAMVRLRDVISAPEFKRAQSPLAFGLGKDIAGKTIVSDVAKMPHVLIAGATGSGKSVCINTLIISLLYRSRPEEVRMIMIDPKVVELSAYNGIPHLLIPVVTDPKKAAGALNWAVQEMTRRYNLFAETGARDLMRYHEITADDPEAEHLPQIVIIIDELADLMMVAPNDVEDAICRIAQLARAAGMHLVIATQRPSVDVITGIIKANIPSRIAFAVSSQVDSRTILDMSGAEKLLGRGDMLFNPSGAVKPLRIQGAYVSDEEVERVVEFIKNQVEGEYDDQIKSKIDTFEVTQKGPSRGRVEDDGADFGPKLDPLLADAVDVVCDLGQASISMLQRRLRLGYARAARMIDELEDLGIIGPSSGSKPREIIMSRNEAKQAIEERKEGNA